MHTRTDKKEENVIKRQALHQSNNTDDIDAMRCVV